jgi:AraC-like DNA-binding protein
LARSYRLRHRNKIGSFPGYTDRDGNLLGGAAPDPKLIFAEGQIGAERLTWLSMYQETRLADPLRRFIDCEWTLQRDGEQHGRFRRVLPDGCVDLVVTLGTRVEVIGPANSFRFVPSRHDYVGVRFQLGAAFSLLGEEPATFIGQALSLEEIWDRSGSDLDERLLAATRPEAARVILRQALRTRMSTAHEPDGAVLYAVDRLRLLPNRKVSQIAADLDLGERHLRRRFKQHVGLSMKQLGRIIRFQLAVDDIRARRRRCTVGSFCWAALACEYGYADQAHFIRECRAIAGATPVELLHDC